MRIPENVRQDTLAYRGQVQRFLDGQINPLMFKAHRVPMGIYEQRAAGTYMVRIRVTAGIITAQQAAKVAQLSKQFGNGIVHVTTRQDLQIHNVAIERTPDVLEQLLEAGLSTRGGGGNTVRNISACPTAGLCADEAFDVSGYATALTEFLVSQKESFNLPRKFKVAFSGCAKDCAFASIADLGFFAEVRDGVRGFAVYAGGGLGAAPAIAVQIEKFITAHDIFETALAVRNLFDKFGDRINRNRARLRFVLGRLGKEKFIAAYKEELAGVKALRLSFETAAGQTLQTNADLHSIKLLLKLGDIPADDLIRVAELTVKFGDASLRTTQAQDILLANVTHHNIENVHAGLRALKTDVLNLNGPKLITCTGAATCKLGLCLSRNLAKAIENQIDKSDRVMRNDVSVRISGCPNACGGHFIADIGLQGRALRANGRLMPAYEVFVGGSVGRDAAKIGEAVGSLPAKIVPEFMVEVFSSQKVDKEKMRELVASYSKNAKISDDYHFDFGANEPFSLAGRGPGECGAGVTDVIQVDINEAKDLLRQLAGADERQKNQLIYKSLLAAARSLLVTFGLEPRSDREIFAAFEEKLVNPGWVRSDSAKLTAAAADWRMGQRDGLTDIVPQIVQLLERVEALFASIGSDLKFKLESYAAVKAERQIAAATRIDLRGVMCPLNFVKAKLALEKLGIGETLEVVLDNGEPIRNVPASFAEQGQEVMQIEEKENHSVLKVKRKV